MLHKKLWTELKNGEIYLMRTGSLSLAPYRLVGHRSGIAYVEFLFNGQKYEPIPLVFDDQEMYSIDLQFFPWIKEI